MSSKARRSGADRGKESGEDGKVDRKMIETIREATGATEEDIRVMLFECNYDANETTSRLIDNPFSQVQSKKEKKKKREEDRKKEPAAKIVEVRRSSSQGGKTRGHERDRSQRGERSERLPDRGPRAGQGVSSFQATIPEKQSAFSTESSAPGGWDHIADEVESEQPSISPLGGETSTAAPHATAWQPIAPPSQTTPIQPPSAGTGGKRSMADLFKKPSDQPPSLRMAPIAAPSPSSSQNKPQHPLEGSEPNGWGLPHSSDSVSATFDSHEPLRQGNTLGGVAVSAPQKPAPSQPVQISMSPRIPPSQQPVGSSSHVSASPGTHSQLDEQVAAPSTTGLGGVPVEAPPRQYADSQTQSAWAPKASAAPGPGSQPTLGSSIMSTLGSSAAAAASSAPSRPEDPLGPNSQNVHQPDLSLGSLAFGSAHSPVILPPSAQQGNSDIGGLSFQFGNFSLGGGPDLGSSFNASSLNSGFEPSASSQLPGGSSQAPAAASSAEGFRIGGFSQPQNSLPSSNILPQNVSAPQQQRAYNAFNSAVQPQALQRPAATTGEGNASQGLYGSQGYSNYSANQYSQHQAPNAVPQASQYQSYGFQTAGESDQSSAMPAIGSHQQQSTVAPPKRPAGYEAPSYTSYVQGTGGGAKDFPMAKYGSQPTQPAQGQHLGSAAQGPSSVQSAAALASQNPLSQITGYAGVGGMAPQGYNYGGQQPYSNYPQQQYNNFGGHPGSNYSYAGSGQSGYQSGGYGVGSNNYGQGSKYNRNYGAGGGAYQQHGGGYGAQPHKQEKEHQTGHLAGHDLYSQQLQLGNQQHYQASGLRDPSNYGYQNAAPGYGGYGRQYNQPYYGREQ